GHRPGDSDQTVLRRRVRHHVYAPLKRQQRGDGNDLATASFGHGTGQGPRQDKWCVEIETHDLIPPIISVVAKRSSTDGSGIVDQDVHVGPLQLSRHVGNRVWLTEVGLDHFAASTVGADGIGYLHETTSPNHDEIRPRSSEALRYGSADAC